MANYVNLTLDTLFPQGFTLKINDGATTTNSTTVEIKVTCADVGYCDGYQLKVWGTADCPTEESASWVNFVKDDGPSGKTMTLTTTISGTDGQKTIHAKLRDDVYNETPSESATIRLLTNRPTIQGLYISPAKVSLMDGKNLATGSFGFDEKINAAKVMIVTDVNATHDNQTNISIPTTNGSCLEFEDGDVLSSDKMEFTGTECDDTFTVLYNINAKDISAVAPGDGVKIIKVFVRSAESGLWSI